MTSLLNEFTQFMTAKCAVPDFSTLFTTNSVAILLTTLTELEGHRYSDFFKADKSIDIPIVSAPPQLCIKQLQQQWQKINAHYHPFNKNHIPLDDKSLSDYEYAITDWLISLFNTLFGEQKVELVRGKHEPEYFPAQGDRPARIEFAHGFFASALHEMSHWCIAGAERRLLPDFGYWYAPDGRTAKQQQAFERVEIKPQALECLFTLACGRPFQVSQDNLFANFDTSHSTFAVDVYHQAAEYIAKPQRLPRDAKVLLRALLQINITQNATSHCVAY